MAEESWDEVDFDEISPDHFYAIIYGCSGSGKTYLGRYILCNMKDRLEVDKWILVSPTECLQNSRLNSDGESKRGGWMCFDDSSEDTEIFESYDDSYFMNLLAEQRAEPAERRKSYGIVIDDCVSQRGFRHSEALEKIATSGRHYGVKVFFILSQNVNPGSSIQIGLRNNMQHLLTASPRKEKDRNFLVDEYFSLHSRKAGRQAISDLTGGRRFAWVNLQKAPVATDLHEYARYIQAPEGFDDEDFVLGKGKVLSQDGCYTCDPVLVHKAQAYAVNKTFTLV